MPILDSDKGQIELYCPACKKLAIEYINPFWEQWERDGEEGKLD